MTNAPCVLLAALVLVASVCAADPGAVSTEERELAIWSPLSAFEQAVVRDIPRARAGDADALLAMYLVAAGDVRDEATFRRRRDEIDRWLGSIRPDAARRPREAARALLEAMHDRFFLAPAPGSSAPDGVPPGYDPEQARLSQVFVTSRFNCMSSALLYLVLGAKLGLEVSAAIIPSHVYVQLRLPDGEQVDIETTLRNGFAYAHDEAFFSPENAEWFRSRGLEPPDREDYASVRLVAPLELAAWNMWDQHVAPGLMPDADRSRLIELRAELLPGDTDAQRNRLAFYHKEYARLVKLADYPTLARMYTTVLPYLQRLRQPPFVQAQVGEELVVVESERALALMHAGEPAQGLALARTLLDTEAAAAHSPGEDVVFLAYERYVTLMLEQRRFETARASLVGIEPRCVANRVCANSMTQLYAEWARTAWEARDWHTVTGACRDYLRLDGSGQAAAQFRSNLEGAYLNWSKQLLADEEWETARERLNDCLQVLDKAPQCRAALDGLARRYGSN